MAQIRFLLPFVIPVRIFLSFCPSCDIYSSSSDVMIYAYIACDLFTNLETFSTLIDFQKKCCGKYTPKAVFVAGLYILSITPNFSRASYSRCSYFFLIDSSQCLLILWKQLSPSTIQWSYWQLIEFWRFVYIMKLYGFGRFRPNMSFCTNSIYHF